MIKLKDELGSKIYEEVKEFLLTKQDNDSYVYEKEAHHLLESNISEETRSRYYNEHGSVEIQTNDVKIKIFIKREHAHKHNGYSGLNGMPNLWVYIYNEQEEILWQLKVESWTLHYQVLATDEDGYKKYLQEEVIEKDAESVAVDVVESSTQENVNYFNELGKALISSREREQKITDIINERDRLISEYTSKIKQEYEKRIKEMAVYDDTIANYKKMIKDSSTFDINLIGSILASIVSLFEGKEYALKMIEYKYNKRQHGIIEDFYDSSEKQGWFLIANESNIPEDEESVLALINRRELIELPSVNNLISFYEFDGNTPKFIIDNNFGYLKEFIDYLVAMKSNGTDITFEIIKKNAQDYLLTSKDKILEKMEKELQQKILSVSI